MPHLRGAIWKELILAESEMRAGQAETDLVREDVNADGQIEVMAGHPALSLLFAPSGWELSGGGAARVREKSGRCSDAAG